MKFTIPTKELLAGLATIKPIAKPSTTYTILGNVSITAEKDSITLLGMDGEKQLSLTLTAKVKEKGATTLPCAKLHDSIASIPRPGQCVIESNEAHECTITDGTAKGRLKGLDPAEMIQQVAVTDGTTITIPAATLNSLLTKSLAHSSLDKSRALLQSVMIVSRKGMLNIQATDGRRCIICATEIPFETDHQYFIPRESVPSMCAIATEGDVELILSDSALSVKSDKLEFSTKLLEGTLSDFMRVIPAERPLHITVNREELLAIAEYARQQTSEIASYIILTCDGSKLSARGCEKPESKEDGFMDMNEDSTQCKKGSAKIEIRLNPLFLRDGLKCFSDAEVKIETTEEPRKSIVIQEKGLLFTTALMHG